MKHVVRRAFSHSTFSTLRSGLLLALACCLMPLSGFAKPVDSTYGYVSAVFDKLQGHWEKQAYEKRVEANSLLTFTLNEDGSLNASHLDAGQSPSESSREILEFLKQYAPFGQFPTNLTGSQLEFKVKLTPGSLQMLGYQLVEPKKADTIVAYAAPTTAQPVSLFYARALPVTPGKVWDKPDTVTDDEQAMASYVAEVQEQIRRNWRLAQDYKFERTVAMVMIDRDGSLMSAQLKQSSGDKTVDRAALNAIYTAGPFPQAPSGVKSLPITIEYIFDPVLVEAE